MEVVEEAEEREPLRARSSSGVSVPEGVMGSTGRYNSRGRKGRGYGCSEYSMGVSNGAGVGARSLARGKS